MSSYYTPQEIKGLGSMANQVMPITLDQEQQLLDDSIKNQINVYMDGSNAGYMGPLSLGKVNTRIEQGPIEPVTDQQRWNSAVIDKWKSWMGGITGVQPLHIDMAYTGLTGAIREGWGSYIPFNPYPWEEVEQMRNRVDSNFVSNKNKEISKAISERYGEQKAPLVEKLLEQNYGYDWKNTFAVGTKNSQAFLEQVNRALLDESLKTTYLGERKAELQNIHESNWNAFSRWSQVNFIKDYDVVRDLALTVGLETAMSGLPKLAATTAVKAGQWSLRIPKSLFNGTKLGLKLEPMFARQEAIMRGMMIGGKDMVAFKPVSAFKGFLRDIAIENNPLRIKTRLLRNLQEAGGLVADTPEKARRVARLINAGNPFNPKTNPRLWMEWNALNIVGSNNVVVKEGLLATARQTLFNNIGLKLDDIINITNATTLGEWMWKFGRTGAIFGGLEGIANSVWMQDEQADQALLMDNIDIPRFDISQTISDGITMSLIGGVFGAAAGAVFSPVLLAKTIGKSIDGTSTLGTANPRRGLMQLLGSGKATQEEWLNASKIRSLLGTNGHQALQIAKTAKLEQVRMLLKHMTGDDRTSNFYLDKNWMEANDISEHEVGEVVTTILEVLSKSSPEYSVNPLSHEMLSEIFTGLAQAKRAAKEAGTPLPSALDADIIGGIELREKLNKYGLLPQEPNEPVQFTKSLLKDEELIKAQAELNEKIKNGQITGEEAETQQKLLNRAKKKNEFVRERLTELDEARKARALLEEQYPDPNNRSDEIKQLFDNYNKIIDDNERYIGYLSKEKQKNHVSVESTADGSIERLRISGYDISNTQAGFLLTRYLSALKRFNEAGNIADANARRLAREKLRAEIDAIETEMDSRYKLNQEGKTREDLRVAWANEKWNQLKNDPIKLAKFEEAFTQVLETQRLTTGQRAVAMNWYNTIRVNTGLGSIYSKMATYGSGTTDAMYQLSNLVYDAFRMVDDGQFFAYSDLANPYQVFTIREAIENGIRKAIGINDTTARIKKRFGDKHKVIQQKVISAKRLGKNTVDPAGLTPEMVEEANLLLNKLRDFYDYSAKKGQELGKVYDDSFTYFPQMLTRKLSQEEVERLAKLGYEAMRRKLKSGEQLSFAELERLGLIERDENYNIVNIPENSLFYLVDAEGKPLPMDEMISRMPKTVEELRAFEAKRRLETDKVATLPPDLQATLNSPIRMSTITEAEKKKTVDVLKSVVTNLLERSEVPVGGEYDLIRAGQHLINLRQRATEFGDKEAIKWIDDTLKDLKERRGIEINENPENPTTTILNSKDNVKPEDKPTLKTIHVGAPEVTMSKPVGAGAQPTIEPKKTTSSIWSTINTNAEFLAASTVKEKVDVLLKLGLLKKFETGRPFFLYENRLMVLADVDGVEIPFYISSGENPKEGVNPGEWYPIFGIGDDGWLIKTSRLGGIKTSYNSEKLQIIKKILDSTFGDLEKIRQQRRTGLVGEAGIKEDVSFELLFGYSLKNDGLKTAVNTNTPKLVVKGINRADPVESIKYISERLNKINDTKVTTTPIKPTTETKKTTLFPGSVFKMWVPESEATKVSALPSLSFTSRVSEEAVNTSPFSKQGQELGHHYTQAVVAKQLASQFGETEPTTYLQTIKFEDLQDSLITMEHMLSWIKDPEFITQVDSFHKLSNGKYSKTDIGMYLLGGYVARAKEYNLVQLKGLTDIQLAKLQREFHNINYITLRSRYEGTPIKALNPIDLLNKVFDNVSNGKRLWTPSVEVKPVQRIEVPTLTEEEKESAAAFDSWWKDRKKKGKTKRSIETRVERLEEALRKLDEIDLALSAKEINPKTGKPFKRKLKLTKEQKEWYTAIQSERRSELARLLSTKEKPISFGKETKKQAKRKIASLRKQLDEVFGTEPTLPTKEGRKFIAAENEGTRIKVESILKRLSENELFDLYQYYNHKAPDLQPGFTAYGKVDPILGFLFDSIDDKANIARSIGKLEELGIEPSHLLADGSVSVEGKVAYLKKLAASEEVQEIAKRFKRAERRSADSKKVSREVQETLAKEYWQDRAKLLEKQTNIREAYHLYVEDLQAMHSRRVALLESLDTFDQVQKGLLDFEDLVTKVEISNKQLNDRFISLNKKIDQVNEVVKKLKEEINWQKNYEEFADIAERKTSQIKELEAYIVKLEKDRDAIQLQLKPIQDKDLVGYNISDVKQLRTSIEEEIKQLDSSIKTMEENDPLVIVERELDQLDLNSKYDGIIKVDRDASRLKLMQEVQRQLQLKRQKLEDLKTMNLGQYNETIASIVKDIDNLSSTIDKLQSVGVTPARRSYIKRLEYLASQIEETERNLAELYRKPEFSLVDPTLNNFSSMYEWMKNVVNTFEERTMTIQDVLQRLATKPDEPTFMNFDASRRTLNDFIQDKEIIMEGMNVGLLFYRVDFPKREGGQTNKSRFMVVDLLWDRFEPIDITGDIQQAKRMIEYRKAYNLENPNSPITINTIVTKREQLAFENPELLKLNKQINRMIKATQKWVDQRNNYIEMVRNPEMLATEFTELVIKDQANRVLNAFNILPAQSELAKAKFDELFNTLKSLTDRAKQVRAEELDKQKQKLVTTFTQFVEASKKEQVPVFNKERSDIIKQLLDQRNQLTERLREYGTKLQTPTLKQKAEGYSLGDFEIAKLHDEVSRLTFALFDLAEGKNVSHSIVAGTNFKTISRKALKDFADRRNLTLKEAKEILKGTKKGPEDLLLLERLRKIKGIKPVIESKTGYQINHRFTATDMLKIFEEGGDQAEALRQAIILKARQRARVIAGKVGGLEKRITEEAVNDALDDLVFLMYQFNQARNNPELLNGLDTVRNKISLLNEEMKTANDIRIIEIEDELRKYREIEKSLRMPDTFKEQAYHVINKEGEIVDTIKGERVYFRSIPGEMYPDTNLTLRGLVNRIANTTIENVRTKKVGISSRPISLDEISDVMDLDTGSLSNFIDPSEIRGRGSNSDYLRPDDILSREENLQTVMGFIKDRNTFIEEAPPVIRRVLTNGEVSQTIYQPFVETVIEVLEEDLKRISNGIDPLYLTKGEKDRVTQRTNIGIIKNQNEFFEGVASALRSKYHHYRVGRTNEFTIKLDSGSFETITINKELVAKAFKQFKKELKIVKDEALADVVRLERKLQKGKTEAEGIIAKAAKQTDPYYKIRLYETRAELGQYLESNQLIDLVLGLKMMEPEEALNFNNWKTVRSISTGERIGGKTQISLADLRSRIMSGKFAQSEAWNKYRIQLAKAEDGLEPTIIPESEDRPLFTSNVVREYISKGGYTTTEDYVNSISLQFYQEQYAAKLDQVASSILDPELVIKWALTEMAELKQKLNQPRVGKATAKNTSLDVSLTTRELTTLTDWVEEFARNNYVGLDNKFGNIYKQALVDSGFSGRVQKAVDPEVLMSRAVESVSKDSPLSEIVTKFNQIDMWKEFEVLSYIISKGSPKELLDALPQESLLNIIDELEEFGLITVLQDKDILVKKLINNEPLNTLMSVTYNGLEVLKTTRHASNRRGYFGGKDIKLQADILQTTLQTKEEAWALRMGMIGDPDTYNSVVSNLRKQEASNGIEEFMVLSFRKELVETQLRILSKADATGLGLSQLFSGGNPEQIEKGKLLLDGLSTKESSLVTELNEINKKMSQLMGMSDMLERPTIKKLPSNKIMKQAIEKPKPLSSKPWLGASDTMSVADKYLSALDGDTRHYVGKWASNGNTGLQEDMRAWAYGMNNQPYTKPTTYTVSTLEKKRPVPYQGSGKPSFKSEDLLIPENAELASMLSDDIGDITLRYAKTSLAKNEADVALRNRIKSAYGIDLPQGFGWGDWVDLLRNVIAKWEESPPIGKDGKKLDKSVIDHTKELIENLNHWVNQNTGREFPPNQLPKDAKRLLRMSKNLTLGLVGPGMGTGVALSELPFAILRKNGSIKAFLKGLEQLFNLSDITEKEFNNTIFAFEKHERGFQSKFGGEGVANDETGYIKRLVKYFKNMFNPNPDQLSSSGAGRAMDRLDNFLANKAALSMEAGGLGSFVTHVLNIAYEKEKVNLFQIKNKLIDWIKRCDNPRFKELAQAAQAGNADAQRELVKMFKAISRESGIPLPIASYLWMSKISNVDEVTRLVRLLELGTDNQGSFDMRSIDKAIYEEGFGSVSNKVNRELNQTTLSKLAYYLEMQARNASPEPFGTGSATFKYNRSTLGSLLTFLMSYPIAAYQTYILRNGTTHGAAAMLAISLGVMGMEIFAKRVRDILAGKKSAKEQFEEYKVSPLAFFLRDLSYAQMGGNLDQFLSPLYIMAGKQFLNQKAKPQDFPVNFAPQIGDLAGLHTLNGLLRQTYQAANGAAKGDPTQIIQGLTSLGTQGIIGKAPADLLKYMYNLAESSKAFAWKRVEAEYGNINSKEENKMHELIKDTLIENDVLENYKFDPLVRKLPSVIQSPRIPMEPKVDIKANIPQSSSISSKKTTKSPNNLITPNIINALMNERGVSPLLVDELIKSMNK